MELRRIIFIEMVFMIIYTEAMNVFQPKSFCGSMLGDTLMKYNCVYHEVKNLDYVTGDSGIVKECCFQRCSEYDLVKSYCSQSDLDSIVIQSQTTPKIFSEEILPFSDEIPSNMLQKDESSKNGNNYRGRFRDEVGNKRKTNKKKRKNTNQKISKKKKNCSCKCINTRNPIINKGTVVKSPVIGVTTFNRNSVIRLASFHSNNIQKL